MDTSNSRIPNMVTAEFEISVYEPVVDVMDALFKHFSIKSMINIQLDGKDEDSPLKTFPSSFGKCTAALDF